MSCVFAFIILSVFTFEMTTIIIMMMTIITTMAFFIIFFSLTNQVKK